MARMMRSNLVIAMGEEEEPKDDEGKLLLLHIMNLY